VIRRYDQAATPLQRVLKSSGKTLPQLQALKAMLKNTDPFELSRHIGLNGQKLLHFLSWA